MVVMMIPFEEDGGPNSGTLKWARGGMWKRAPARLLDFR
jgi:hypothetical protein